MSLELKLLPDHLAVCRLPANSEIPAWAMAGTFRSISWTANETSIVCEQAVVPCDVQSERGFRALMIVGPLNFDLTGILLMIAQPLAEAGISIFAISTFHTDYVLVKGACIEAAAKALVKAGHRVQ